jgi:hypothetical protein
MFTSNGETASETNNDYFLIQRSTDLTQMKRFTFYPKYRRTPNSTSATVQQSRAADKPDAVVAKSGKIGLQVTGGFAPEVYLQEVAERAQVRVHRLILW